MKNILFFISIFIVLFLIACDIDETPIQKLKPKACFSIDQNPDFYTGDTLKFLNCSENGISFIWDFGDGNISTEKSPWHVYQIKGNYSVKLFVNNKDSVDIISKPIFVAENYYTDLHDTLVRTIQGNTNGTKYYLDIDKDGIKDVEIETSPIIESSKDYNSVIVTPLNGFKISYSEMTSEAYSECESNYLPSTVMVPKLYKLGETILVDNNFTLNSLGIYFKISKTDENCYSYIQYGIESSSNYYLAFYKENGSENTIAWLNILEHSVNSITISGCYYSKGQSLEINR